MGFSNGPVRIDGHALENCGERLSDAIGGYEKAHAPETVGEGAVHVEDAVVQV